MATVSQSETPSAPGGLRAARRLQTPFWLACLVGAIVFPLVITDGSVTSIAVFTLIFAVFGTSWNIFSGYTGYIALCHSVFFGIGCYTIALMCEWYNTPAGWQPFAFVPLAGVVAAIVAAPLGAVALRTRRHTFVVITIAIFFIFQLLATNLRGLTNGSTGLSMPIPLWSGAVYNLPFYYVSLAILLLAVATSWYVRHSKYGLELLAIRDDEDRARGLGVRTEMAKLSAFMLSAVFVGMVGAVWAYYLETIYPAFAFNPLYDVLIALICFLGGLTTISGPLLGALIVVPVQQYFNIYYGQSGYYQIFFGAMFLLVVLLMPQGIVPAIGQFIRRVLGAGANAQLASGPAAAGGAEGAEAPAESRTAAEQR